MLEILNFIFRDFWTFWGVVILLYVIGDKSRNSVNSLVISSERNCIKRRGVRDEK